MISDLVNQDVEWSLTTGYDYDGRLERVEADDAGRVCMVCTGVRKRIWVDDRDRENGAHEFALLPGERWIPLAYVVESGPCGYPRPKA